MNQTTLTNEGDQLDAGLKNNDSPDGNNLIQRAADFHFPELKSSARLALSIYSKKGRTRFHRGDKSVSRDIVKDNSLQKRS